MKRAYLMILTLLLLPVFAGAGGSSTPENLKIKLLAEGAHARGVQGIQMDQSGFRVFQSKAEMEKFAGQYGLDLATTDSTGRSLFVAVFMGQRNSGGYAVRIENANLYRDKNKLELGLNYLSPGKGTMVTMAITSPFAVYQVELPEGVSADKLKFDFYTKQGSSKQDVDLARLK